MIGQCVRRDPTTVAGVVIVGLLALLVLFPNWLAPASPTDMVVRDRLSPPTLQHPFGTDQFGRDLYSRVVHGARISLLAGAVTVALAALIGTTLGGIAGYAGGRVEMLLMRLTDLFLAFPFLIIALAIAAVLGRSITNAVLGLALVWWAQYARLIRGQVLSLKERPYIEAARVVGATDHRILVRHILPGTVSPLLVKSSLDVGQAVLATASMSFLGLGAAPPSPEWGALITDARHYLQDAWWYITFPGLAMIVAVLGFNLLGDAIRDLLDPRIQVV
ncbi:MAG: ABC transporter permease [Chloroflexi bacterium]|nr:ABC transporter permease [Chloroflexota bacterium]